MRLLATEPTPDFVVWNFQEYPSTAADSSDPSASSILSLLRSMATRMASDPGRLLRPLTDVARDLCGADAAGICMERDGQLVPAETLPILLASGSCSSLSGSDVPRAQSACSIAIAENRPKLFQIPTTWLPINSAAYRLAHGFTAPWSAGKLRGTLWILKYSDTDPFGLSKYRTLLTLAELVGSAFQNLAEQESWQHEVFVSTYQALMDTLLEQVQLPLHEIRQQLELCLRQSSAAGNHRLWDAADNLRTVSDRIDAMLAIQTRPVQ